MPSSFAVNQSLPLDQTKRALLLESTLHLYEDEIASPAGLVLDSDDRASARGIAIELQWREKACASGSEHSAGKAYWRQEPAAHYMPVRPDLIVAGEREKIGPVRHFRHFRG